jgi:hypothetical protein
VHRFKADRNTRMAISLRLAARSLLMGEEAKLWSQPDGKSNTVATR